MHRSDLFAEAEVEWSNVRTHLNMIAGAFGYPVLSGKLVSSR
jgi:hypothetical protein